MRDPKWKHISATNDGLYFNPEYGDVICARRIDGYAATNLPRRVSHYNAKPDWSLDVNKNARLEFGLIVMDLFLPTFWRTPGLKVDRSKWTTKLWDGKLVSDDAFAAHPAFADMMNDFLLPDGGVIPGYVMERFITEDLKLDWSRDIAWGLTHRVKR